MRAQSLNEKKQQFDAVEKLSVRAGAVHELTVNPRLFREFPNGIEFEMTPSL